MDVKKLATTKGLSAVISLALLGISLSATAGNIVYVGEDSGVVGVYGRDYRYVTVADPGGPPAADWFKNSFDHSSWSVGETVFGNSPIDSVPLRTAWPADNDVYIFKTFTLGTPVAMVAKTAVDNGYALYINDVLVAGANAEGFTSHWEYIDNIGASFFQPGLNWLAVHLEDHGGLTAWDFALVGDEAGLPSVPEPSALALLAIGLASLGFGRRRSR